MHLRTAILAMVMALSLAFGGPESFAQKAKAQAPTEVNISDTLGWVYVKKNLSEQAIKIFREILEKDQGNATFRYHLAVALAQKGDKPTARKECELALRNKPNREDEGKQR